MRGCGAKYFSTQKIYCMYSGGDEFPYTTFTWEGIDGSEVLASMHNDYNSQTDPAALITRWNERRQKVGLYSRIFPFGWGDGGGGPTRTHLEFLKRSHDLQGLPRIQMEGPIVHFKELERRGYPDDRYVGELYFQAHRGVQTTQAKTKKGNRKSEFALREAELWGATARALAGYAYPLATIDLAWKQVLLSQFHDILPGSSIHRVYEEAEAGYARVMDTAEETAAQALAALTDDSAAMTIFNSLSWARSALVALPEGMVAACDTAGEALPVQQIAGETLVEVTVPACGWTTVTPAPAPAQVANTLRAETHLLENDLLRLEFNAQGEIVRLFDKEIQRELATGPCNSFRMYKDVPRWSDAWDIEETYKLTPVALPAPATCEVVDCGPLVATLRITRLLHESSMTQEITLRRGSRRVDFVTTIDWHERHKLLKVDFPVAIHTNEALHEIQFGHIARPNHGSRPFDADRFETNNQKWTALLENNRGCAVLNDCKYGVSAQGETISLTLLRSPQAPDMTADQGLQEFTYAFYAWNGSFAESELVREGYDLNIPVTTASGAAGERSLFAIDAPNIIIETVKPAEDGSADIVLRLYEAKRMATRCTLSTSLPIRQALATNMLEQGDQILLLHNGEIALDFRPFEIKTVRLKS